MKKFLFSTVLIFAVFSGLFLLSYHRQARAQQELEYKIHQIQRHISHLSENTLLTRELFKKNNEAQLVEQILRHLENPEEKIPRDSALPESTQQVITKHFTLIEEEQRFFTEAFDSKTLTTHSLAELVAKQTNLLRELELEVYYLQFPEEYPPQ